MKTLAQAAGLIVLAVTVGGYLAALATAWWFPLDLDRRK